jgi:site-specific DNA recombinase
LSHSYSSKGSRQYRYYVCNHAQKRGWKSCPSPSLPAGEIEAFVVDQIKCIGRDPGLIKEILAQARNQAEVEIERLTEERGELRGRLRDAHTELGQLAATCHLGDPRVPDGHERIREMGRRLTEIEDELVALDRDVVDEAEVATALADFDAVWKCLAPREQARVIELLIAGVTFDGAAGNVAITYRPSGIRLLAAERKEVAA